MPKPDIVRAEPQDRVRSLLLRLRRGVDVEESFRQIFRIYHSRVHASFPKSRVSPEDRKDLTQEVFLRVHRAQEGCPEDAEGFERWLFTVARHVFLSWLQSRHRLKRQGLDVPLPGTVEEPGDTVALETPQDTVLDSLLEEERARILRQAMEEMPGQMRACLRLRVESDRTDREIAAALRLAPGTVKAHLYQARQRLLKVLGPYFKDFNL